MLSPRQQTNAIFCQMTTGKLFNSISMKNFDKCTYCWNHLSMHRKSGCWWPACEHPGSLQNKSKPSTQQLWWGISVNACVLQGSVHERSKSRRHSRHVILLSKPFNCFAVPADRLLFHNYNKKSSYRVMFFKTFKLSQTKSFLPARSHSSVSVALDRASSNSGSRVVTSSWRVSIGFSFGTNALPMEEEGMGGFFQSKKMIQPP